MTARVGELVSTLEQRVAQRTGQLQAAADISRATASERDQTKLLTLALALIRDRMGYYHASIFLLDEAGDYAVLRESTGPVGAQLKARGHRLAVGSRSLIGWVTGNRQPRIASDVGEDPFYFKNPLLPDTRAELAIPLMAGDRLLGALDVQSTQSNAFSESDVQVMQTLADQLSVAIENAALFARTEANLKELSTLYQRLTSASWRNSLGGQARETVYNPGARMPATAGTVTVPLLLRGEQVGEVELQGRRKEEWPPEEMAALNAVAAQLTSALESAALLEEAQRRRAREQTVNDIANLMRASLDPTVVMQSGIRELGRALGATEVIVRLAEGPAGTPAAGQPARREA
jgi:GAF domain-containing protein